MQEFELKITGSGTKEELIESLRSILDSIEATEEDQLAGSEWENPTLMTEID